MCAVGCCVSKQASISCEKTTLTALRSWLVYKVVDIIRYRAVQHPSVLATGIITNVAVIISVLSAFPWIRKSVLPYCLSHRAEEHHPADHSAATTTTRSRDTTASSDGWALRYVVPLSPRVRVGADRVQATWVFVILGNTYDIKRGEWRSDANSLLSAQELWFAAFMTILCVFSPLLSSLLNSPLPPTPDHLGNAAD